MYNATDGVGIYGANYVNSAGATGAGVWGRSYSPAGEGVLGNGSNGGDGVYATSDSGYGVYGTSTSNAGVYGASTSTDGVYGTSTSGNGVSGKSTTGPGLFGLSTSGPGVTAESSGVGSNGAALLADAGNAGTTTPAGIAVFAENGSADTTILAQNTGTGGYFRAINAQSKTVYYIDNGGTVHAGTMKLDGGGDVAEQFATPGARRSSPAR